MVGYMLSTLIEGLSTKCGNRLNRQSDTSGFTFRQNAVAVMRIHYYTKVVDVLVTSFCLEV